MKTADKYRETIVNLEYELTETPIRIYSMGYIGWDVEARDKNNTVIIESAANREVALRKVFEQVIVKEGHENLDKPSRGEILATFRCAYALLNSYAGMPMPQSIAGSLSDMMGEILQKIDKKPARKAAMKRKPKSRKS